MDSYEEAVLFTLAALESRLDRVEYVLSGGQYREPETPRTLAERMQRIESSLQELSEKTQLLNQVQELISKHSDILEQSRETTDDDAPGLSIAEKAAMVTERAPVFATTASQLKALDDQQIPETEGFTKLVRLRPRIAEAEDRQLQQALEISMLRRRSGLLVQRLKRVHMAGQARCWKEWQKRISDAERTILRAEFKKKQLEEEG